MSASADIRNVSFVGHPSSGKTTLVDALSHLIGASPRKGSVSDKTSICDTEPEEQDKQHTLQAAFVFAEHGGHRWTLMDTPGYPEFRAEANGAMFASDLVIGVVSCSSGVTFNLRSKMEAARGMGRGRAIILTHLDAENTDFDEIVMALRDGVGEVCVPVLLPDKSGPGFSSVKKTLEAPESSWLPRLMDRAMDACEDEALMEKYLETQELSSEDLHSQLPNAIRQGALVPVLVCNAEAGVGLEEVLDFIAEYAPSPDANLVDDADGEQVQDDPDAPLAATVFNVKSDPHVGKVCLARVFRGTLTTSDHVAAEGDEKGEKLGGLFRMVGKKREPIEKAGPGDIIAFSKVENLGYGQSFSVAEEKLTQIPMPKLPSPMVSLSVVPRSRADEQKIGEALHKLTAEDPTFKVDHAAETHELIVSGMSDLHLQVMEARLKRRFGVEIDTNLPKIAYKETITKAAEGHHRHKKQSGGRGQFGECYMRVRPLASGEGLVFKDAVVGGSIPRNLIPAVEKGIRELSSQGILTGSTVVDVEAEVYDGKFHAVDSDEASFKVAGARAFRDCFEKAGPVLLEPVMELEIRIPTSEAGTVFSDITSHRRGHVLDQWNEADGAITAIKASVPLSMVQTYHRDLKSQTAGEGTYSMELSSYERVPASEQAKVLAAIKAQKESE